MVTNCRKLVTTTTHTPEQEMYLTNKVLESLLEHNTEASVLLRCKQGMTREPVVNFDHQAWNNAIRQAFKREAEYWDRVKTAQIQCANKGHDWHVRSQAAWDAGYDEPVICYRCGEWDM